jgi:hypothetical protein
MFTGLLQIATTMEKSTWRRIDFVLEIKEMTSLKLRKKRKKKKSILGHSVCSLLF